MEKSVTTKLDNLDKYGQVTHWMYDSLIFSYVKAKLGKYVRLMFSCGGYIPIEVLKFLKIAFCVDIC